MAGLIDSLLDCVNCTLGVRDSIGAVLKPVYFVRRTWYADSGHTIFADQIGESYAVDVATQMLPSPGIKEITQDIRIREGGVFKSGDIILTSVSKESYDESDLDGSSSAKYIENLYLVGDKMYWVVNIKEKYVTWSVLLRELTNQARY